MCHSRFSSGSKTGWATLLWADAQVSKETSICLFQSSACYAAQTQSDCMQVAAYPDLRKWANSAGGDWALIYETSQISIFKWMADATR